MKQLIIILLIVLSSGCSSKHYPKDIRYENFPKTISLIHEKVITPPVLFFPAGMVLLDSVLITVDLGTDIFFQVFKMPDLTYLGGQIHKGKGPGEEIFVNPYMQPLSDNDFLYQTQLSIKRARYNVHANAIKIVQEIYLPGELMNINHVFSINDLYYGCEMISDKDNEFVVYNPSSKQVSGFGPDFPKLGREIEKRFRNTLLAKAITVKPDNDRFAAVYDKFPILRIYSKEGEILSDSRYHNGQHFPEGLTKNDPTEPELLDIMQNYRMIKSTNRYIYALYIGKTIQDLGGLGKGLDDFSNEIHVWEWNGNPVRKILLDKSIFTFCVTQDDKIMICTSVNSLDKMFKYSLQ
ncbi:MAG: hypothetical protein D4R64_02080 [Porphyromonadaceae bacterium]|nr:MAG: hypothetical protein D4R64_02080 [Porphyromonadaceae bacterium]